jgi:hypothetical protein
MPRENSFSDTSGRSLTPDLEDELAAAAAPSPSSPISPAVPTSPVVTSAPRDVKSPSIHSKATHNTQRARPSFSAKDRFRATVRKVIQLQRSTTVIASHGIGAEPGVDPRRESALINYGHIKQDCVIEVVDYSAVRSSVGRMTNREFVNLLNDPAASSPEPWVKVRWINIGGISWDIASTLALKYGKHILRHGFEGILLTLSAGIHPLALEDVLHQGSRSTRSKADYYPKHLFLRILCHELEDPDELIADQGMSPAYGSTLTEMPRSCSPPPFTKHDAANNHKVNLEAEGYDKVEVTDEDHTMYNGSAPNSRFSTRWIKRRRPLSLHHQKDLENTVPTRSKLSALSGIRKEVSIIR